MWAVSQDNLLKFFKILNGMKYTEKARRQFRLKKRNDNQIQCLNQPNSLIRVRKKAIQDFTESTTGAN